jgi:hypothetical protein
MTKKSKSKYAPYYGSGKSCKAHSLQWQMRVVQSTLQTMTTEHVREAVE